MILVVVVLVLFGIAQLAAGQAAAVDRPGHDRPSDATTARSLSVPDRPLHYVLLNQAYANRNELIALLTKPTPSRRTSVTGIKPTGEPIGTDARLVLPCTAPASCCDDREGHLGEETFSATTTRWAA